tara:strand:+ start:6969 stop:7517 length:549 start_codon:yes stop_codon:yes gene_type:complete
MSHKQLVSFLRGGGLNEQHVGGFTSGHLAELHSMTRFRGETERHEFSASKGHKHAHDDKGSAAPKSQRMDDTPDFSKRDNREEKTKSIMSTDGDYHFLNASAGAGGDHSAGPPSKGGGKGGDKDDKDDKSDKSDKGGKGGGKGDKGGGKGDKGGKGGKDWGDADKDGMPNKIDKAPKNPTKK